MTIVYRLRTRSVALSKTVQREPPARCWMICCSRPDVLHQRMPPSPPIPSSDPPYIRSEATAWPPLALSRSAGIKPGGSHILHSCLRDVSSGACIVCSYSSQCPPDGCLGCAHFRGSSSRPRSIPKAQCSSGLRGCEPAAILGNRFLNADNLTLGSADLAHFRN